MQWLVNTDCKNPLVCERPLKAQSTNHFSLGMCAFAAFLCIGDQSLSDCCQLTLLFFAFLI